ncbi:MAG: hypothetical protein PHO75_02230 [Candidatus Shapirobacteria bacterium]|nr:hypothetical protein [Candidatus Shapirobacteria bacterium]
MQFNPTDKSISLVADIDFLLFGDGETFNTDYSLVDRARNINVAQDEAVAELFKADPNFMWDDTTNPDFPIATLSLVENRDNYVLPDASLVFNRVRIKDENGNFQTLTPCLRREVSDSDLDNTGHPTKYYKIDNAIFPIPVPNYSSTNGIEIEFQRGANHFVSTDTTKTPGFASQFHQFLSVSAALRYAIANGMKEKVSFLSAEKEKIRLSIQEHYQRRSPDERPKLRLKKQPISNFRL